MIKEITDPEYKVETLNKGKTSYWWEGWNIIKFTNYGGAVFSNKGSVHNGKYGYREVITITDEGTWIIA